MAALGPQADPQIVGYWGAPTFAFDAFVECCLFLAVAASTAFGRSAAEFDP